MKILVLSFAILLSYPLFAFEAVSTSRSNFGNREQTTDANQENNKAAVPGTRTFSTYSSRQHNWSKGVETKPVQTQQAQQVAANVNPKDIDAQFTPNIQLSGNEKAQPATGKKEVAGNEKKQAETPVKNSPAASVPKQPQEVSQQNAALQNQQIQQLMQNQQDPAKMMESLQGMMGGGKQGGMPDISALMNSFTGGAQAQSGKK
jgi:hypothetical protein